LSEDYFRFTNKIFDQSGVYEKPEALAGIRVLDLSRIIFGPMVSKWLGMFGAEVIKVEEPDSGDGYRGATYWAKYWKDSSPYFQLLNPNKYFITINLHEKRGKDLVLELAKISDVVVENFRAGLVEAWGLGFSTVSRINPKVIYISCCGYGQWGPLRFFPSYDLIAQSMSGVARSTGFPGGETYKLQDYYADFFPGLVGAIGVLSALNHRERTGKGQYIDMAQAEAITRLMHDWTYMGATGEELKPTGNFDPTMAPSGIFKTGDEKFVALAAATDEQFSRLLEAMGRSELAEDEKFKRTFDRLKKENAGEINRIVEAWVASRTEEEIVDDARRHGFPAAPVMDDWRIVNDAWRRERGSVVEYQDEMYGKGTWPGPPVALEKTPGRINSLTRPIGYHNRYVFKRLLGMKEEEIKELEKRRVIGYWENRVGARPPSYWDIEKDPMFNYGGEEEKA
jgi:crotonobetainyl-CoA:carnitine CoA-transferase CaiB-like acyl-CoA transferase